MRILYKEDVLDIIYAATLLGTGGGGTITLALRMLDELEKTHKIQVKMIETDEMEQGKYACMVAGMGSPVSLEAKGFGKDAVYAFKGYQEELRKSGKDLAYTYSGEYGGLSTFVSIYVSILCDVPFVNLDGNGRAVPEMGTTLLPLYRYPTSPFVLANENGDVVVCNTKDPYNTKAAEKFARVICVAEGMKIGFACWAVDRDNAKKYMIPGGMDKLLLTGRILRNLKTEDDPVKSLSGALQCRELFRGTVSKVDLVSRDGFDFGITYVETGYGTASISFKNENILAKDERGDVILTVPESICLLDVDNFMPLTNAAVKEGMRIIVIALPAAELWWHTPDGYDCWREILKGIGYNGEAVCY